MVVSNIFSFHPYLGKIPILTNSFQMGWNHQLDNKVDYRFLSIYRPFSPQDKKEGPFKRAPPFWNVPPLQRFRQEFPKLVSDPKVKAIVVTGKGNMFCGGALGEKKHHLVVVLGWSVKEYERKDLDIFGDEGVGSWSFCCFWMDILRYYIMFLFVFVFFLGGWWVVQRFHDFSFCLNCYVRWLDWCNVAYVASFFYIDQFDGMTGIKGHKYELSRVYAWNIPTKLLAELNHQE